MILCQNLVEFSISYGQVLLLIMNDHGPGQPTQAGSSGPSQTLPCVKVAARPLPVSTSSLGFSGVGLLGSDLVNPSYHLALTCLPGCCPREQYRPPCFLSASLVFSRSLPITPGYCEIYIMLLRKERETIIMQDCVEHIFFIRSVET